MTLSRRLHATLQATLLAAALSATSRIAAQNATQNGTFDSNTVGWSPDASVTLSWSSQDAGGSATSGSALVTNHAAVASSNTGIGQCVPVTPGPKTFAFRVLVPSAQGATGYAYAALDFYAGPGCTGAHNGGYGNSFGLLEDKWQTVVQNHVATAGTQSVAISLNVAKTPAGGSFQAYFDDVVVLTPTPQTLTIPASASIHGQNGNFFHTDVWLFNGSSYLPLTVTARHRCFASQTCAVGTRDITGIPARSLSSWGDFLVTLFNDSESAGAIELTYDSSIGNLVANSRTYTPSKPSPTVGTSIPALPASAAKLRGLHVGLGSNGGNLTGGFRSNAGVYNPNAVTATVTMTLLAADGSVLGAPYTRIWGANEAFQLNDIFAVASAGATVTTNATLLVVSNRPIFSYVTVIDNQSGDQVYIAAADDIVTP